MTFSEGGGGERRVVKHKEGYKVFVHAFLMIKCGGETKEGFLAWRWVEEEW